jgi:hypothetical protein
MTVHIVFTIADPRLDDRLATEAASILRGVVERIEDGEDFAALFDSKGNEVGTLRVTD